MKYMYRPKNVLSMDDANRLSKSEYLDWKLGPACPRKFEILEILDIFENNFGIILRATLEHGPDGYAVTINNDAVVIDIHIRTDAVELPPLPRWATGSSLYGENFKTGSWSVSIQL